MFLVDIYNKMHLIFNGYTYFIYIKNTDIIKLFYHVTISCKTAKLLALIIQIYIEVAWSCMGLTGKWKLGRTNSQCALEQFT